MPIFAKMSYFCALYGAAEVCDTSINEQQTRNKTYIA